MKRIAVVEDNPDNLLLASALLESEPEADYELDLYENGYGSIEGVGRRVPGSVFIEISLPDMHGAGVLARVRGPVRSVEVCAGVARGFDPREEIHEANCGS